jgi:V/A-type H+-transporting ATPase subunit E
MEKTLERSEDKIQKICDALRKETLEPAKEEAERIIADAKSKAEQIIKEAHKQAEKNNIDAKKEIEQERNVFHSSLDQAARQVLEEIRQAIEHSLFSNELHKIIYEKTIEPQIIAKFIDAIVKSIEKEGISTDLSAIIPQSVSAQEVNRLLGEKILNKLKEKSVELGELSGGAQVKLHNKKMTIEISDKSLMELLSGYVRKDFRKLLFKV